ncbi:ankyrin repeat domain-containing protein [Streptomyces sp. NPDC091272]|uniref:ankyrin repeat domain-containing protein n=1 Tax=Streptomyces sp. NPDC091272 TaxID=3365981 RepID=UPI0037F81FB1
MGADHLLARAIIAGDLPRTDRLLNEGADPDAKDPLGNPPLALAAARGQTRAVHLLLAAGADPHLLDTRMGASALHKAAQSGAADIVDLLLDHGAFIDLQAPTHGHTPLIDAVWHKRPRAVARLLARGANPLLRAHGGYRADELGPLACDEDQNPYLGPLAEARARRERADAAPLRRAALDGDAERVRELLGAGHDVDAKAPDGHTALLDAAREGHPETVRVLLGHRADPRVVDHLMKATPAHKAAYNGRTEVLAALVDDPRLEIDAQGPYNGYTALHDAVWHGHLEGARVLLKAGARTDLRGRDGRTPREMAREYGYDELVQLLAEHEHEHEPPGAR